MSIWFWWTEPQAHSAGAKLKVSQAQLEGSMSGGGEERGRQRGEVEGQGSRSCRALEAGVSHLDFISSAVGGLEQRRDVIDLHFFQGLLWCSLMDGFYRRRGEEGKVAPGLFIMLT